MLRVMGRALRIVVLLVGMLAAYILDRTKLRLLWWKVTGSGAAYVWHRDEVIVREAFEAMGPTFIKLGQVIASSPGLFPQRYTDEFSKCLDQVPPFDMSTLKEIVAADLGRPIPELFSTLEDRPLGSASIAQVHAAVLHDGRQVVVKVQRPGIADVVDADLWWMHRGAALLEFLFKGARLINLTGLIEDFGATIHAEIDFCKEAANLKEFNEIMKAHAIEDVSAPAPMEGMVTRRVLVMERFQGFKVDDIQGMIDGGLKPERVLRLGIRTWLLTVLLHGFFHGDAHAGNVLISRDGRIGFIDFGIIGRFDHQRRHQVLRYILAFGARDYAELADILIEIGAVTTDVDRDGLVAALGEIYAPLFAKSVQDISYHDILPQATRIAYEFGVTIPKEFMLVLKQLLFFDRYAKRAAPDLNVFSDYYLVDFLFTPAAMKAGLDFNVLMPLLRKIQDGHRQLRADQERENASASESSLTLGCVPDPVASPGGSRLLEGEHVVDVADIAEQHGDPVKAHGDPARRRHP